MLHFDHKKELTPQIVAPLSFKKEQNSTKHTFEHKSHYLVWARTLKKEIKVDLEELLFVGYSIDSPANKWNDYKEIDVKGKVLLSFVNEPTSDPSTFDGPKKLSYFGRWTYKLEEAERKQARGIVFVHTRETAGYDFTILSNQNSQYVNVNEGGHKLEFVIWITEDVAKRLFEETIGSKLSEMYSKANHRDFAPIPINLIFQAETKFENKDIKGINVMGVLRGELKGNIILTSHHDHFGMGASDENGDTIFNGFEDNCSGTGGMLGIVGVASTIKRTIPASKRRTLLFLSVTGEEVGLLGSSFYVSNSKNTEFPCHETIACFLFDILNVYGMTNDVVGLGSEYDQPFSKIFSAAAHREGLVVAPDPNPNSGSFFRSDAVSFHKLGIPTIYLWTGSDFKDKPKDYAKKMRDDYVSNRYHKQSDNYSDKFDFSGLIQQVRVTLRCIYYLLLKN